MTYGLRSGILYTIGGTAFGSLWMGIVWALAAQQASYALEAVFPQGELLCFRVPFELVGFEVELHGKAPASATSVSYAFESTARPSSAAAGRVLPSCE